MRQIKGREKTEHFKISNNRELCNKRFPQVRCTFIDMPNSHTILSKFYDINNVVILYLILFCSFVFWIFFLAIPHQDDRKVHTSFMSVDWKLDPTAHIFLTDVIPLALSYFCAFAAIHLNGYVGILDCNDMDEIYIRKRKGGQIRTQTQQDAYKLDLEDPDRELDCSDDNLEEKNSEQPPTKTINLYANEPDEFLELR